MLDRELAPDNAHAGLAGQAGAHGGVASGLSSSSGKGGLGRQPLYAVSRVHLDAMTDDVGLWQHARGEEPDRAFGYCTDDVAREIVVDVLHARELGLPAVEASLTRSLRFLEDAFRGESGRFLNMRDANGTWLDIDASEDCHARTLVGLAAVMAELPGTEMADGAAALFVRAAPAASAFGSLRPICAALIASESVIDCRAARPAKDRARATFDLLADRLADASSPSAPDWPWPESVLTYENAIVPRALLAAGQRPGRHALFDRGLTLLDWLIEVQTGKSGFFSPVGNGNWWPRGGVRSQFDQQPIEAATLLSAAAAGLRATGRPKYAKAAEKAYGWFLGDNDLGVAIADPERGACYDGLGAHGPNTNQGAESTLMWLWALEQMRGLRLVDHTGLHAVAATGPGKSKSNTESSRGGVPERE